MPDLSIQPTQTDRDRQKAALTRLRQERFEAAKQSGDKAQKRFWELTSVASRIGVSASSLQRYESGKTMLPSTHYQPVAEVYGITRAQLIRELGLLDDDTTSRQDIERIVGSKDPKFVESVRTALSGENEQTRDRLLSILAMILPPEDESQAHA